MTRTALRPTLLALLSLSLLACDDAGGGDGGSGGMPSGDAGDGDTGDGDTGDGDAGDGDAGDGDTGDGDTGDGDVGDGDAGCIDADCDDGLPETIDSCSAGTCDARRVYYDTDLQPVFQAHCNECHGEDCFGGQPCFAGSYAPVLQLGDNAICQGMTVARCTQIRIRNGSMPEGAGCSGDPTVDADNPACLDAREHALLDAWIAGGAPEAP